MPEPGDIDWCTVQLEAILAGIARARDDAVRSSHHTGCAVVVANGTQVNICQWLQHSLSCWPLQSEQCSGIRLIEDMDILELLRLSLYPCEVFLDVGCVDDEHVLDIRQPVNQQVIDYIAVRKAEGGVERLLNSQAGDIVGHEILQESDRAWSFNLQFAHVAHVKEACPAAYRTVLFHNAAVLKGHLPATELHE